MTNKATVDQEFEEIDCAMLETLQEITNLNKILDSINADTPAGVYNNMVAQYDEHISKYEKLAERKKMLAFGCELSHLADI